MRHVPVRGGFDMKTADLQIIQIMCSEACQPNPVMKRGRREAKHVLRQAVLSKESGYKSLPRTNFVVLTSKSNE
jgi:hypothetical protein